jgi:hypothetical protein
MKAGRSDASLQWEKVGDEQVLKLWKLEGPEKYPQISVLRVSNITYLKFFQDAKGFMEFVNEHPIFSKPVIVAGPWVSLSSADQKDEPADWVLTLVHGKMSTAIVAALPQLKLEDASSKTK